MGELTPSQDRARFRGLSPLPCSLGCPICLDGTGSGGATLGTSCQLFALLVPPSLNSTTCSFLERTAGTKELKLSHFSCCLSSIQHSCLSRRFSWLCLCVRTLEMGRGAHAANPMVRGR